MTDLSDGQIEERLEGVTNLCIDYVEGVFEVDQDAIDTMYSLSKHFKDLSPAMKELYSTVLIEKSAYVNNRTDKWSLSVYIYVLLLCVLPSSSPLQSLILLYHPPHSH